MSEETTVVCQMMCFNVSVVLMSVVAPTPHINFSLYWLDVSVAAAAAVSCFCLFIYIFCATVYVRARASPILNTSHLINGQQETDVGPSIMQTLVCGEQIK